MPYHRPRSIARMILPSSGEPGELKDINLLYVAHIVFFLNDNRSGFNVLFEIANSVWDTCQPWIYTWNL
jgi:hypothetical protein